MALTRTLPPGREEDDGGKRPLGAGDGDEGARISYVVPVPGTRVGMPRRYGLGGG